LNAACALALALRTLGQRARATACEHRRGKDKKDKESASDAKAAREFNKRSVFPSTYKPIPASPPRSAARRSMTARAA
jgi:hypothetical protein